MSALDQTPVAGRIFVVQDIGADWSQLRSQGELIIILGRYDRPRDGNYLDVTDKLQQQLADATRDDWLLPAGDPVAIGLATGIMLDRCNGQVNFMRWDRISRGYHRIVVNMTSANKGALT